MNRLMRWLDGEVERLCNWLNDVVSGRRPLARLGSRLAGVWGGAPLPVDRRKGPEILQMHTNQYEKGGAANAKAGTYPWEGGCGFWAYCHMSGEPCVWCGGKNALSSGHPYANDLSKAGKDLCPSFHWWGKSDIGSSYSHSSMGVAWYGCCNDPYGKGKLIAFLDCCGSHAQPCSWGYTCKNWPGAKNWCTGAVTGYRQGPHGEQVPVYYTTGWEPFTDEHYYCTVVIDINSDGSCN
jgi:hypothetical protein